MPITVIYAFLLALTFYLIMRAIRDVDKALIGAMLVLIIVIVALNLVN